MIHACPYAVKCDVSSKVFIKILYLLFLISTSQLNRIPNGHVDKSYQALNYMYPKYSMSTHYQFGNGRNALSSSSSLSTGLAVG